MCSKIKTMYRQYLLCHPLWFIVLSALFLGFFAYHCQYFRLDASADALLLEKDKDLRLLRETSTRYGIREFLFVSFSPKADLFSASSLALIKRLRQELEQLEQVETIISLIDVPLVLQKPGTLAQLADNIRTLESDDIDRDKAREELINSPIYRDLILSRDGQTTALQLNLSIDPVLTDLRVRRDALMVKQGHEGLDPQAQVELAAVQADYQRAKRIQDQLNHQTITRIREVIAPYQQYGRLYLGGIPLITNDMIAFIQQDLLVFGGGLFLFLVGMLAIIFRQVRWIILPLTSCLVSGLSMIGLLGLLDWEVTVISSNFIALMLILTMSMNIHLIVRYRQLSQDHPQMTQPELVLEMAAKMVWPCLYTGLTTIIAFSSLIFSGIKPVIHFGWMMTIGLCVTFMVSFVLFPCLLVLLPRSASATRPGNTVPFTERLATLTQGHGNWIVCLSILLAIVSLFGISRLEVENSFINYFRSDTEIHQGLRLIDQKLGGTTPLDITLALAPPASVEPEDEFDLFFGDFEAVEDKPTWLNLAHLDQIKRVHDYLEGLPGVGKVLSFASVVRMGEAVHQREFDPFEFALLYRYIPADLRATMIEPYLSVEEREARINIRIIDSLDDLRRKALLETLHTDLVDRLGLSPGHFQISGALVLYNNMLQSLFRSQILTLAVVMLGIGLMLHLLFRSLRLALIGIIPNVLAAALILGLMGLLRIPLDMMTITIAAITIGIAVDNSIHYIYRFREEYRRLGDYTKTMTYCHANIGRAVFYTAITIIIGFSILTLSNFIPTVYFGLLTALAMGIALLASLTLLPRLIVICRPFR